MIYLILAAAYLAIGIAVVFSWVHEAKGWILDTQDGVLEFVVGLLLVALAWPYWFGRMASAHEAQIEKTGRYLQQHAAMLEQHEKGLEELRKGGK